MLDRQCHIYSLDTNDFFSNREKMLHKKYIKIKREKRLLREDEKKLAKQLEGFGVKKREFKYVAKGDLSKLSLPENATGTCNKYRNVKQHISHKTTKMKEVKQRLLDLLENKANVNIATGGKHHIRTLRRESLIDRNVVSVFDSYLTRTIGAEINELTKDFMVLTVYHFNALKDLMYFGFYHDTEKYVYFTSSAGQIRRKKAMFIRESVLKEYGDTLTCGITVDMINRQGGLQANKYLSYLALATSATDPWEEFDIEKSIVVDDFETDVFGQYDYVDDTDYSITRREGYIPIPHTDGAGMILPNAFGREQKNMIIRGPWCKGLLSPFPFDRFATEKGNTVIKDVYGVEHDIIEEDIQVIFTASQYKLYKYMDWENYKANYKKFGCSFGIASIEQEHIGDGTINYQMLQSLTDITDEEIEKIAQKSNDDLLHLCDTIQNMQRAFGIDKHGKNKTYFQKAVEYCPELMNDVFVKDKLRGIKNSMVKRFRAGHLRVGGKYTYVLPDFYAACEYWFLGDKNPKGLLNDGEVFCSLLKEHEKLDCLRSPHLDRAHPIKGNVAHGSYGRRSKRIAEWFDTKGVYTSTHDLISKNLQ